MGILMETWATHAVKNRMVGPHLDFFQPDIFPTGLVQLEALRRISGLSHE